MVQNPVQNALKNNNKWYTMWKVRLLKATQTCDASAELSATQSEARLPIQMPRVDLGALPTHPELLDSQAAEYRDNGWSLKKFLKAILKSRTYQQSSTVTAELRKSDPRNEFLSRGVRFRLSAETVRDESLAVSGLLSEKMGGPPVMPPQPDGMWRSTYNGQKWVNAEGEDRFRRAIYTRRRNRAADHVAGGH